MDNSALIIVDVQNDFFEGGTMAIKDSLKIISVINRLKKQFNLIIFSKDWHPYNHSSFKKYGGKWPIHCVQDTRGASFHKFINFELTDIVIHKGTRQQYDSYSAFYNAQDIDEETNLNSILKRSKITDLYICGLATEYCVLATTLDAYKFRYNCYLITNATAGLDEREIKKKYDYLQKLGINLISSEKIGK